MKLSIVFSMLGVALAGSAMLGQDSQTVKLEHKLQIPGATLKPGEYTFMVEDRLQDRAIIRITDTKKNSHELVLAVPSDKLNQDEHGKLIFFSGANVDKQILQGWMCPSCQSALELVYPKNDAVKITGETAKAVLAVDPTYDKLPKNLSSDDMKVVTLWLLSPKEVTAEQRGKGVAAAKYADVRSKQNTELANASSHAETTTATASTETPKAVDQATTPPSSGANATASTSVTAPAPDTASTASSTAPTSTTDTSASTEPTRAPDGVPGKDQQIAKDYAAPAPAVATTDTTKSPVEKSSNTLVATASKRRMPHTASNTYDLGLVGLGLLLAGSGLYAQRRLSKSRV